MVTLIILLCVACGIASASPLLSWTADIDRVQPVRGSVYRGETLDLACSFVRSGVPLDLTGSEATLYWQTNGMASAWWSASATVGTNGVTASFTPEMQPNSPQVLFFIGAVDSDQRRTYRATGIIRLLHAPGPIPNNLPIPPLSIDFDQVAVKNAPWIVEESDPLFNAWLSGGSLTNNFMRLNEPNTVTSLFTIHSPDSLNLSDNSIAFTKPGGRISSQLTANSLSIDDATVGNFASVMISPRGLVIGDPDGYYSLKFPKSDSVTSKTIATLNDVIFFSESALKKDTYNIVSPRQWNLYDSEMQFFLSPSSLIFIDPQDSRQDSKLESTGLEIRSVNHTTDYNVDGITSDNKILSFPRASGKLALISDITSATNAVESRRELHWDESAGVLWRTSYSNGYILVTAVTNTPTIN